ncbi:MAG: aldehyde ferredoxin oxidoreductase family protein, partial [Candidatus Hodarchaeota archaeon]
MQNGYSGKILKIDLSTGRFITETHDMSFYRRYFGGRTLAAYYLLKEQKSNIDPLAPENTLVFATSIGVGAVVPGLSRYIVAAKSPLTNGFGETEAGGYWGPELKRTGFDAIVITGKAERPSYLWIKEGSCELHDAEHLWGMKTKDVELLIRQELGDERIRVAQTGPAGENLVRYACVVNDLTHVNGRSGMGAVMGSKNLRAIALRGTREITLHDPEKVKEIARWFGRHFRENPSNLNLHKWGTTMGLGVKNEAGELPTRNFQTGILPNAEQLYGEYIAESIYVRSKGCFACPVACKRHVEDTSPYEVDASYGCPEYETLGAFGGVCAVTSLNAVAKANELCNAYTLDTISTGATIAFAMECFEEGLLSKEDTNGIDLAFGNGNALIELIEKITHRDGIGDLLAEGALKAAQKIGKDSERFVMHVKGKELAFHDPRVKYDLALQYALSPSGADHVQADH